MPPNLCGVFAAGILVPELIHQILAVLAMRVSKRREKDRLPKYVNKLTGNNVMRVQQAHVKKLKGVARENENEEPKASSGAMYSPSD